MFYANPFLSLFYWYCHLHITDEKKTNKITYERKFFKIIILNVHHMQTNTIDNSIENIVSNYIHGMLQEKMLINDIIKI